MNQIDKQQIEESFRGKLWTYVPVVAKDHHLGVAVANEAGYTPVPYHMTAKLCADRRYETAKALANQLNADRGQSVEASLDIVCSSMAQGSPNKSAKFKDWGRFHNDGFEISADEAGEIAKACDYYCINDCGEYLDHEFYPEGDLRTRFVISKEVSSGEWSATIFLAADGDAPFDDEGNMPAILLEAFRDATTQREPALQPASGHRLIPATSAKMRALRSGPKL